VSLGIEEYVIKKLQNKILCFFENFIFIYTNIFIMNQDNTKLTTVKILKDVYSSFKKVSFDSDVTLQKLVNRTVERYVKDDDFRKEMNEYLQLQISGSQF
jgi:hypothetical protein